MTTARPRAAHERSRVPALFRRAVLAVLPSRYQIPARYYYRRAFGTLDPEFRLLPRLVRPAARAIDAGANLGVYTWRLSRLCRSVEAFEPVPQYADTLRAMRAPNVTVHQQALSSETGRQRLYFEGHRKSADLGQASLSAAKTSDSFLDVQTLALDELGFPDVGFLKIDVEGHELAVLRGATGTIRRTRPAVLVEIEQRHLPYPMTEVFAFLHALGYQGAFLEQGRLQPLERFSYERHQEPWLDDVFAPGYVNNFIFVDRSSPLP